MTAFEITIIAILSVIMLMVIILVKIVIEGFHDVWQKLDTNCKISSNIRGDTVDIFQELNNIEDNILDDLRDIRLAQELGKTSPNVPITPCYTPDGICTNPQMDCIGCPRRGDGGTWSTNISIKAKDAPLQERFNDNKDDGLVSSNGRIKF